MNVFSHLRSLWIAAGLVLCGVTVSNARPVYITDNGGFFSESAKAEATRRIAALEQKMHKEVVVETFGSLPGDLEKSVNVQDKAALARAVQQWAVKQIKAHDVNGVYILLVKSPPHLQIEVGPDTQKRAFTLADRDSLTGLMLNDLRAKRFDDALTNGVDFITSTMLGHEPTNLRAGPAAIQGTQPYEMRGPREQHHWGFFGIIFFLVVIWVIVRLIGALFRGLFGGGGGMMTGTAGYGGGPMMGPMGGGGGGFFSSLLGGIFGAAAGNWMYDRFSGSRENPTFGSESTEVRQVDDGGFTGKDTYENFNDTSGGGGGDFGSGDSGGGGDFGSSGDSGGGDFGGGDSGGGGGDSGGGGGGDF